MNKKILSIALIGIFLLASISSLTVLGAKLDKTQDAGDNETITLYGTIYADRISPPGDRLAMVTVQRVRHHLLYDEVLDQTYSGPNGNYELNDIPLKENVNIVIKKDGYKTKDYSLWISFDLFKDGREKHDMFMKQGNGGTSKSKDITNSLITNYQILQRLMTLFPFY